MLRTARRQGGEGRNLVELGEPEVRLDNLDSVGEDLVGPENLTSMVSHLFGKKE
jgi:hypothetical protein